MKHLNMIINLQVIHLGLQSYIPYPKAISLNLIITLQV